METPQPLSAAELFDQEFLTIRCKILDLAAALDRIDRGPGAVDSDPRMKQIRAGLEALLAGEAGRAERVQLVFSDNYEEDWFDKFEPAR